MVPTSALTALQALTDVGRLEPGQTVLVTGASGGVGSYAVQVAKAFGTEVTGIGSTAKLDLVRSLGADHVLDYARDDFADGGHRCDLILDIAGNPAFARLRRALSAHRDGRHRRRRGRQLDRRHRPTVCERAVVRGLLGAALASSRASSLERAEPPRASGLPWRLCGGNPLARQGDER